MITVKLEFDKKPYVYKDGKLTFWVTGITKEFATVPQIEKIFEKANGTKVLYRHRTNADGSGEVHGYVKQAEYHKESNMVSFEIELHGVTEEDKRVLLEVVGSIELALKYGTKPHGISVHFQTVHLAGDRDQTPIKFHLEEVSVTPIPACKECLIELEEKQMEEVKMEGADNIFAKTVLENKDHLQKKLVEKETLLEELSSQYKEIKEANTVLLALRS